MSSRRQKLLARVNWYLQSSSKHITELITGRKSYDKSGRYRQVSLYHRDGKGWSACFRNALIDVILTIIKKCLFYYLYIIFNTSMPTQQDNEYKNFIPLFFILGYFYLLPNMHTWYTASIQPFNNPLWTLAQHGCWPVGLVPIWLQGTCNNPDGVRWSTHLRNVLT